MQMITPCLWFDQQAEEAVKFYGSIFKGMKVKRIVRNTESSPGPNGEVLTIAFQMMGQDFTALNGGPVFKFNEAMSLVVNCKTQREVDTYWEKLSEGGSTGQCGWLKDKFGVSWQIVPIVLFIYLADKNPRKTEAVMQAMMKMTKLDIKGLKIAHTHGMKSVKTKNR